jgi:hypothetical protein
LIYQAAKQGRTLARILEAAKIVMTPIDLTVFFFNFSLCRSREFLWQEGHTAFATKEEADQEADYSLLIFIFLFIFVLPDVL